MPNPTETPSTDSGPDARSRDSGPERRSEGASTAEAASASPPSIGANRFTIVDADPYAENTIRPARRRARSPEGARAVRGAESPRDAPRRNTDAQEAQGVRAEGSHAGRPGTPQGRDESAIPDAVRARFVQVGRVYYFQDGARAFEDRGRRLTTPSENTEVIRSLIAIAEARGWDDITVTGTERFRRSAWQEATLSGLTVHGYRPSAFEQARIVQLLSRSASPLERAHEAATEPSAVADRGGAPVPAPPERPRRDASTPEGPIFGELIERGRAPYRFDPHEDISYFVKLKTASGERTVWGRDLERAFEESITNPTVGDEIGLRAAGRDRVTVKSRERDENGQVLSEHDLATHRNRWVIEKRGFFESRREAAETLRNAKIPGREGARADPLLVSSYLALHGAERLAERLFSDPVDRARFTALVREKLGDRIEQGEAPPKVRLKDRARVPAEQARGPISRESELNPARG